MNRYRCPLCHARYGVPAMAKRCMAACWDERYPPGEATLTFRMARLRYQTGRP